MSDTKLKALLQCMLAGPSRAALMTALTTGLGPALSSTSPDEPASGMPPMIALRSAIIPTVACIRQGFAAGPWLNMMQSVRVCFWHAGIFVHGKLVGCCCLVLTYCTCTLSFHVQAQDDCMISLLSCASVHRGHAAHKKTDPHVLGKQTASVICMGMLPQVLGCRFERR